MAELSCVIYQSLGLPCLEKGKKLPANYNSFTKKVDGNTDSNLDGKVDARDKNGFVEPEELYQEIFSNRRAYRPVIQKLYQAGLEDPFEERDEVKVFAQKLFKRYMPKTELAKAILLFRSVIPTTAEFKVGTTSYRGLKIEEGGLAIPADDNALAPLRKKHGDLLPKELINAPQQERIAHCMEYSSLLVSLFRAAGLKAHIRREPEHIFVIAKLNNIKYKLDAAYLVFHPTTTAAISDREGIASHYSNEGVILYDQGKIGEALNKYNQALEIDPNQPEAWMNKGFALSRQGNFNEAIKAFKQALRINPKDDRAWAGKGYTLYHQRKLDEAMKALDKALNINPNIALAWNHKGIILIEQGKLNEAVKAFDQAVRINPNDAIAWRGKGAALLQQGKLAEANKCFEQAKTLENK